MRLLIATPDFPLWDGGVASVAEKLAEFLQRGGEQVTVFTPLQTDGDVAFDQKQAYQVVRLRNLKDRYLKYFYACWQLRRLAARQSFDAILVPSWFPYAAAATAVAPQVPLFLCVYGNDFMERRWERPFWRKRLMRSLEKSRLLLAGSQGSADAIREFWPAAAPKTVVVTPAVDPAEFQPAPGRESKPILLTLARLVERKGQDMVIRALPEILKEFPAAEYWLAGRGSFEAALRSLSQELGVEKNVRFLGFVSREERIRLYQQCSIYLMPSRTIAARGDFEAFGITFLEANACGKPVIGGRSGGVADAVADGVSGFLVDPNSPAEIAARTLELLRNPVLARRLGEQGRERVERELNWETTAKRVVELISSPPVC